LTRGKTTGFDTYLQHNAHHGVIAMQENITPAAARALLSALKGLLSIIEQDKALEIALGHWTAAARTAVARATPPTP
jgi:hypothetical protein